MMMDFKPLVGVRVLDFSHVIAGPLASFYLAQMGAEVIKVESRDGGDVMRRTPQGAASFLALNAGKTTLALDLADEADHAQALAQAQRADVLLDNLRPGVLERFGLGADVLHIGHPGLIYCTISGYGRSGVWQQRAAYDHVIQAATGMMLASGRDGDPPMKMGFPAVDAATGILAALAIVSALRERDTTGVGRVIDCSMTAAAMQLMYPFACAALTIGTSPPRVGNQGFSGSPSADLFETREGWIALGANTPKQLLALLQVLGRPEIAADPACFDPPLVADAQAEFVRAKDPQRLRELLDAALRERAAAELEDACAAAGVPAARVRTVAEFATEAKAHDALGTLTLSQPGCTVISPGLGFRVR